MFSSIHNRATIFITKPGAERTLIFRDGTVGCILDTPRKQWPNFGIYVLSENKLAKSFVLIPGRYPVSAARSETTHYRGDTCENYAFLTLGPEKRRRFLAQMLNIQPDDIGWENELQTTIEFKSEEQFYQDLVDYIEAQQDDYQVTANELVAKNLMTAAEKQESLPQIDLYFEDQRGPGYAPIAEPPLLPPHVTWPGH